MKILIVAAHPDDEILGCGGAMARWVRERHDVTIGILGEGLTSRLAKRTGVARKDLRALQSASVRAAAAVGVSNVRFFHLPDNQFDTIPLLKVVKMIEKLCADVQPEIILTQHGGDLNIDHVVTFRAVMTAVRPMKGGSVRRILAYEVASSTEWAFGRFAPRFQPNWFVDISATLEQKIRAMKCYEGEVRKFPHPRSPEALRAAAQRWGTQVGFEAAEAFELVWEKG